MTFTSLGEVVLSRGWWCPGREVVLSKGGGGSCPGGGSVQGGRLSCPRGGGGGPVQVGGDVRSENLDFSLEETKAKLLFVNRKE